MFFEIPSPFPKVTLNTLGSTSRTRRMMYRQTMEWRGTDCRNSRQLLLRRSTWAVAEAKISGNVRGTVRLWSSVETSKAVSKHWTATGEEGAHINRKFKNCRIQRAAGGDDSPSRLSWASEDRFPDCSWSWRNWMMEKARRLLSVMVTEVRTSVFTEGDVPATVQHRYSGFSAGPGPVLALWGPSTTIF